MKAARQWLSKALRAAAASIDPSPAAAPDAASTVGEQTLLARQLTEQLEAFHKCGDLQTALHRALNRYSPKREPAQA